MAKRRLLQPWWLEDGTEICPICHHVYLYETEYRCNHCDGRSCPNCVDPTTCVCVPCSEPEPTVDIEIEV